MSIFIGKKQKTNKQAANVFTGCNFIQKLGLGYVLQQYKRPPENWQKINTTANVFTGCNFLQILGSVYALLSVKYCPSVKLKFVRLSLNDSDRVCITAI